MAIIRGDNTANTISATGPNDTIFGLSGFDYLSSTYERADLRGGWGQDQLIVDYDYTFGGTGPYPYMRWSLSGDQGNDVISASVAIVGDPLGGPWATETIITDIIIDGGAGDDQINVDASIVSDYGTVLFMSAPVINTAVFDLEGNNTINIITHNDAYDVWNPETNTIVVLGDGNDNLSIDSFSHAYNDVGANLYDIDLGEGNNVVDVNDVSGFLTFGLTSGAGVDVADLVFWIDGGNSVAGEMNVTIDLGDGGDSLSLMVDSSGAEYSDVDVQVDLGDGDNTANIVGSSYGVYHVVSGSGNDNVTIDASAGDGSYYSYNPYVPYQGAHIDAGDGNNKLFVYMITVNDPDPSINDPYYPNPFANVKTGSGADNIYLSGGAWNTIDAGAGNDAITAGSGTDTISMGTGSDSLAIDRAIYSDTSSSTQQIVVNDFRLTDGDKVVLSNWNIPALGGTGVIDDANDLQALKIAGGDVISFAQLGADALLTMDLGGGNVGEILFRNLDISAPPPPPPPVTDPKMTLNGTYGNDILTGGNNDDTIFLRRGNDTATGGDGADVFRFNAVNSHNSNGDHHTITDLDFLEGDELRFHNFGPSWADDATDPNNALIYLPGSYNTWIADSIEDLREMRDSGALSASSLSGGVGTQIAFTDQGGDLVTVDLWGVIV